MVGYFGGHKGLVTCVAFAPPTDDESQLLLSGDDTGRVRLWRLGERSSSDYLEEHKPHSGGQRIACLAASESMPGLVASTAGKSVEICLWRLGSGKRVSKIRLPLPPTYIALSPHRQSPGLLLAGLENGKCGLHPAPGIDCSIGDRGIQLTKHEREVHTAHWRLRVPGDDHSEASIIATSGAEGVVNVSEWEGDARARYIASLKVPPPRKSLPERQRSRLWIACTVIAPNAADIQVVASAWGGDVALWRVRRDLNGSNEGNRNIRPQRIFRALHSRTVFNIVHCRSLAGRNRLLTSSMDRASVVWQLPDRLENAQPERHLTIEGLGGFAYDVGFSLCSRDSLAVACGDGSIRILKANEMGMAPSCSFGREVQGRATVLCWHPSRESILAFATSDGHIGMVDVDKRAAWRLPECLASGVVSICWRIGGDGLFCLSADGALCHVDTAAKGSASPVNQVVSGGVSALMAVRGSQWDSVEALIGLSDGRIWMVNNDLVFADAGRHHLRPVTCLALDFAQRRIASASDDGSQAVLTQSSRDDGAVCLSLETSWRIHTKTIRCLAWSLSGMLVSGSTDGLVRLWDTRGEVPRAKGVFHAHAGPVLTCCFSPSAENCLLTGGEDQCVRLWDPRMAPTAHDQSGERKRKLGSSHAVQHSEGSDSEPGQTHWHRKAEEPPKRRKQHHNNVGAKSSQQGASLAAACAEHEQSAEAVEDDPAMDQMENNERQACLELAMGTPKEFRLPKAGRMGVAPFAGSASAHAMLRSLETASRGADTALSVQIRSRAAMWRGDFLQAVEDLYKVGALGPDALSAAAASGKWAWRKVARLYALQLEERGDAHGAAAQLVTIGESEEAAVVLSNAGFEWDAATLCSLRLGHSHPATIRAFERVGLSWETSGEHIYATKAYASAGSYSAAARCLARRGSLDDLRAAVCMAQAGQREASGSHTAGIDSANKPIALLLAAEEAAAGEFEAAERAADLLGGGGESEKAHLSIRAERILATGKWEPAWYEGQGGRVPELINLSESVERALYAMGERAERVDYIGGDGLGVPRKGDKSRGDVAEEMVHVSRGVYCGDWRKVATYLGRIMARASRESRERGEPFVDALSNNRELTETMSGFPGLVKVAEAHCKLAWLAREGVVERAEMMVEEAGRVAMSALRWEKKVSGGNMVPEGPRSEYAFADTPEGLQVNKEEGIQSWVKASMPDPMSTLEVAARVLEMAGRPDKSRALFEEVGQGAFRLVSVDAEEGEIA